MATRDKTQQPRDPASADDVVRRGGIAEEDSEIEDVTRDTYGFTERAERPRSHEERVKEAERAAEQAGLPGVEVPDPESAPSKTEE